MCEDVPLGDFLLQWSTGVVCPECGQRSQSMKSVAQAYAWAAHHLNGTPWQHPRPIGSTEEQTAQHAQARSVACPSCGAPAGSNCHSASGKTLGKDDHAARVRASQAGE